MEKEEEEEKKRCNGIFDLVVWNNICKYVTDFNTWITLSKCCKTTFNATRHGGGGNVKWNINSVLVLHKLLAYNYSKSIKAVSVPDLAVYTALCLAGWTIESLTIVTSVNESFVLTNDNIYQGGILLDELVIKRKGDCLVPTGITFWYFPPNLTKLEIDIPKELRRNISVNFCVKLPERLKELTLHCGPVGCDGYLKTLPDTVTTFRFIDKYAFEYCPSIPIGIEILNITGDDHPGESNLIFVENVVYPNLRQLRLRNTLPSNEITTNRIVKTSQFPNIEMLITHHVILKNDAKLPFRSSLTLLDECTRYKFNKEKKQQRKRLKI